MSSKTLFTAIIMRGCLHDIPARVHSGSLLWLCIRLHDTNTKCRTGASSPRFLCRSEIFIPARKFIPVSCKRGMTVRFISIKVSSILRHYKTRTPTNTGLCKHGATFHLAPEWKSRRYHVNTPSVTRVLQRFFPFRKLRFGGRQSNVSMTITSSGVSGTSMAGLQYHAIKNKYHNHSMN